MADATVKHIDEMESFYDGMVVRARAELGVTSWGMQVFTFPAGFDQYPNHHHGEGAVDPGQEELYIPLAGSAELRLNGAQIHAAIGHFTRGKDSDFDLEGTLREFAEACAHRPDLLRIFLEIQVRACLEGVDMQGPARAEPVMAPAQLDGISRSSPASVAREPRWA